MSNRPFFPSAFSNEINDELTGGSDRACAIVGEAIIDDLLKQILEYYLIQNHDEKKEILDKGSLRFYDARVKFAYAIGLIQREQRLCFEKIGEIRNIFGHWIKPSFADEKVKKICQELKKASSSLLIPLPPILEDSPRAIYIIIVVLLANGLNEKLSNIKKYKMRGNFDAVLKLTNTINMDNPNVK